MRVFLDHCLPKRLLSLLPEHEVKSAYQMGGQEERELLRLVEADFEVFITVDQNLRHQQNLSSSRLVVIVLIATSNQYDDLAPLIPQVKQAITDSPPGSVIEIS